MMGLENSQDYLSHSSEAKIELLLLFPCGRVGRARRLGRSLEYLG